MYKTLKIKADETNIFVTSDQHHHQSCKNWTTPLWRTRGYNSVQEHDDGLIDKWNSVCNNDSIVFQLGDFIFEDPDGINFWSIINRLDFKDLHILRGNHTSAVKPSYNSILAFQFPNVVEKGGEVYPLRHQINDSHKSIIFWPEYIETQINKDIFVLCHYPIVSFNGQAENNVYHLSGHCHQNLPLTNKDTGKGRRLDCGVDGFRRPLSIKEIKVHLATRLDKDIQDHHTSMWSRRETQVAQNQADKV